ncbi:KOW motif domain-containing protein [Salipaludibacillus daqingensis]|uniref:KOW motif domain-containing protein n=1 Tax=Salipaludibacillus daqingensis TaxID=3041001 RepID=UPI002473EB13|nr:KOW motif domain-containing protein [Salipaludibacillus daqingensis]
MAEQEEPLLSSGDTVKVTAGEYKGKQAKVISSYTNSISVEFDMKLEDGSKPRTVLKHTEYELVESK